MIKGIDVSNHQRMIDWQKVAQDGYEFAFIKVTEGINFDDPYFIRNWNLAKANGLYRGAYHFPRPWENDPRSEADWFINNVGPLEETDMLVLDMEVTLQENYGDYGSWALYFLQIIESYVGFKPLIYTAQNYISALNLAIPGMETYGLWLASWITNWSRVTENMIPKAPEPWPVTAFWQYTSKGRVSGIEGDVDLNLFNGTVDRLPLYGKPKQNEPQPQPIDLAAIEARLDQTYSIIDGIEADLDAAKTEINEIRKLLKP